MTNLDYKFHTLSTLNENKVAIILSVACHTQNRHKTEQQNISNFLSCTGQYISTYSSRRLSYIRSVRSITIITVLFLDCANPHLPHTSQYITLSFRNNFTLSIIINKEQENQILTWPNESTIIKV